MGSNCIVLDHYLTRNIHDIRIEIDYCEVE